MGMPRRERKKNIEGSPTAVPGGGIRRKILREDKGEEIRTPGACYEEPQHCEKGDGNKSDVTRVGWKTFEWLTKRYEGMHGVTQECRKHWIREVWWVI